MPRFVRPFWVRGKADGMVIREFGPRRKDGGIQLTISQRNCGEIMADKISVIGTVDENGFVTLRIFDGETEVYKKLSVL